MSYPRRILLALTGLSPQVLTETLYAMGASRGVSEVPNEIHVVTTGTGRRRLAEMLGPDNAILSKLAAELGLPAFQLPTAHIHVIKDAAGTILEDISNPEENVRYANLVTSLLRELTTDPLSKLDVSIAGGRKTMGFLLGYAFSLFARPQDQLSHVLVSYPFEAVADFHYPTKDPHLVVTPDGRWLDARDALVNLVAIPVVSLRAGLPVALLTGASSYEELVGAAKRKFEAPRLVLRRRSRLVTAGGVTFRLPPEEMIHYLLVARRTLVGLPPLPSPAVGETFKEWHKLAKLERQGMHGVATRDTNPLDLSSVTGRDRVIDGVSQALSRLKSSINKNLGMDALPYLVFDGNSRPRRYSLRLPPIALEIVEE